MFSIPNSLLKYAASVNRGFSVSSAVDKEVRLRSTPNSVFSFRMILRRAVPASLPFKLALDSTSSAPALCSTVKPMAEAAEPTTLKL